MNSILKKSFEIDTTYSINSFFYILRKIPIFKDLITEDIYKSTSLKRKIRFFSFLYLLCKKILLKLVYFLVLFYSCQSLFPKNNMNSFFHVYFIFTIIGFFINNKLLNVSKKKYICLLLFEMNDTSYLRTSFIWNQMTNLLLNGLCFFMIIKFYHYPISYSLIAIFFSFFTRVIGEALNYMYYQKYHYIWYSNTRLYFFILGLLLSLSALPLIHIELPFFVYIILIILSIVGSIPSWIYLWKIKNYKAVYKKINSQVKQMDSTNEKDYMKQMMVEVKAKDKKISEKKIRGKKGYDLFNTIFFERHKEILLRSSRNYGIILIIVYIGLLAMITNDTKWFHNIHDLYEYHIAWFVFIMYFMNRGSIVTQAMFFNCDHAMLRYNFYREPSTILSLFKKRLMTTIKVNMFPTLVIAIGNIILEIVLKDFKISLMIIQILWIISLNVFFSTHYLIIYYLLQPYNKDLEIKKISYSVIVLLTYFISYQVSRITTNTLLFLGISMIIIIGYITLSLRLVYKLAPSTFKLN